MARVTLTKQMRMSKNVSFDDQLLVMSADTNMRCGLYLTAFAQLHQALGDGELALKVWEIALRESKTTIITLKNVSGDDV